jgi:hypothetical protein
MTDETKIKTDNAGAMEAVQILCDDIIFTLRPIVPPRIEGQTEESYDDFTQQTLIGNAIIRILISISTRVGPLNMTALRIGALQAMQYVESVSEPVDRDESVKEPSVH